MWTFWKFNIRYQVDPEGIQWVQEPRALWQRKTGDCKSLSVAVMATLYELGIKASFRFACYNPAIDFPTHVYVVVLNNGNEIPVDCVWKEFGTQKAYQKKWDYNMTAIYRLSGIDEVAGRRRKPKATDFLLPGSGLVNKVLRDSKPTDFLIPGSRIFRKLFKKKKRVSGLGAVRGVLHLPVGCTHEVAGLLLDKQYLEMQQIKSAQIHGIGSTYDRAYEMEITAHHNAVAQLMGLPQRHCVGYGEPVHPQEMVEGIAGKKGKARKLKKAVKANSGKKGVNKRQAKLLKKAGVAVTKRKEGLLKRVAKGIKKIVKAPARLALRAKLPKAAPFFLYTYITDERILAKMPEQVAIKRNKAMNYKKIIVEKLEMPEANFDKSVRNGIMNAFAKSPEEVLAKWMADANFQVGVLPIIGAAFGVLKGLFKALLGKAAANLEADIEKYSPAPEDWGALPGEVKQDLSQTVQNQPTNTDPAYRLPQTETKFFDNYGNNPGDATPGSYLNTPVDMEEVVVRSGKNGDTSGENTPPIEPDEPEKKDNTMLFVGLAAVGVAIAMGGKSKGKKRA